MMYGFKHMGQALLCGEVAQDHTCHFERHVCKSVPNQQLRIAVCERAQSQARRERMSDCGGEAEECANMQGGLCADGTPRPAAGHFQGQASCSKCVKPAC